ncbi:hypothetical protein LIIV107777_07930 [Listeria ivanovii subsp. ivanovii]|nr:Uncharacterised protein [Listeria ivanovii subsp. ivanovii]SNV92830.1 Uncharacterised protein [Listeria ivanovii subsp. ivanovii]
MNVRIVNKVNILLKYMLILVQRRGLKMILLQTVVSVFASIVLGG